MKFFAKKPAQPAGPPEPVDSAIVSQPSTVATQPQSSPNPQAIAPVETSSTPLSRRKWTRSLLGTLFVLALMALAVTTYMWYEQKTRADGLIADVSEAKWIADDLRDKLDDIKLSQAKSEDDAIRQAVRRFKNALLEPGEYDVTVDIRRGDFSLASIVTANKETDEQCYLKKVGASWVLLVCKRSPLSTQEIEKWGIPDEIDPAKVNQRGN